MARLLGATLFVFVTILALFFGVGMLVLSRSHLPMPLMLGAAAGLALLVVLVQFAVGPTIIDSIVKIRWADPRELGTDFDAWLRQTCATFRIPTPRFGIIEEAAPNAFTYGYAASDARVVVSRGVVDALTPDELRAVVAHELGHIKHRDFIVMTAIQALVLAMYALYAASRRTQRGGWYVVIASYVAYWVSYYASLYLSRIREYMADYASAQITGRPNDLAQALVKIAYGLAQTGTTASSGSPAPVPTPRRAPAPALNAAASVRRGSPVQGIRLDDPSTWPSAPGRPAPVASAPPVMPTAPPVLRAATPTPPAEKRKPFSASALGAFGVLGAASVRGAVAWTGPGGLASPDNFVQAARWEIFNPWAKVAEVCSTHPLTALRIRALQKLNPLFGQPDAYDFSKIRPARYRGFVGDLLLYAMPTLFAFLGLAVAFALHTAHPRQGMAGLGLVLFFMGMAFGALVQLFVKYPGEFVPSAVLRLLGEVDVSPIRCKPVALEGTFTGRLSAGIAWASDYVFQDATGFVACLYRQPLGILKAGFGLLFASQYVGRPVRVYGWYRRFNAPYVEIARFQMMDTGEIVHPRTVLWSASLYVLGLVALSGLLVLIVR